jgi:hypothetical protein
MRHTLHVDIETNIKYKNCQYVCKTEQSIGHECRVHPFQASAPERTEAWAVPPDATGRPSIALCTLQPPALPDTLSASASGFPGVPDSSML